MNKANVFLLVVVSSLLTYISTATQPAATAGVAQEKWEYGVSVPTKDQRGLVFTSPRHSYWVFSLENEGLQIELPKNPESIREADSSINGVDGLVAYYRSILWYQLGDHGWHPYQVIPSDETVLERGGIFGMYKDAVYWRRRVQ